MEQGDQLERYGGLVAWSEVFLPLGIGGVDV
jgi:hypothetical protein